MFSIGFACETDSEVIFNWFSKEKEEWERKGIYTGELYKHKERVLWEFDGTEDQWQESIIPYLASSLCDYMIEEKELYWVKEHIERTFFYREEAPAITEIAHSLLEGEREEVPETNLLQQRKHFVYHELTEEIKNNDVIQWDPMLTFRLGNYHHLLMKAASAAIDEYKWEQEYQTMIEACRHYLKYTASLCSVLHVLLKEKPVFLDKHLKPVDQWTRLHHLEPTLVFEKSLPFEYMAVSPAVSLAPKELHVYADGEEGTVQTFEMIFQEKLIIHPQSEWPLKNISDKNV
ncbi:sporulation protein YtxC [Alteribacillus bidgolensis]|uniref:Putative sporulation protein YtxC n=1 Tax=Alteribacillus bidgolensis TaxID=930129 RepID=A0A1G8EYZ7_9BACI|nr:sporulation protein YtxC [Alteribacillus bidgolensis]SDH75116.1 putative sporulation protein YtxC [Alteribacillus bidgolensis]